MLFFLFLSIQECLQSNNYKRIQEILKSTYFNTMNFYLLSNSESCSISKRIKRYVFYYLIEIYSFILKLITRKYKFDYQIYHKNSNCHQ